MSRRQSLTPFTRRVSHTPFIAEEAGCSQNAVFKHVTRKLSEREKCGRKRCTTKPRESQPYEDRQANRIKNLANFTRNGLRLGSRHQEPKRSCVMEFDYSCRIPLVKPPCHLLASRATTHRHVKEFGYSCRIPLVKPLLNPDDVRGVLLTWKKKETGLLPVVQSHILDDSKFCISFGNQGPRVWRKGGEAHSPSCLKFSVKFPQSVMILGCNVICWCWSIVFF